MKKNVARDPKDFRLLGMRFHLSLSSGNAKTGNIPVSTTSSDTCPDACPLKDKGCYARFGPLGIHWSLINKEKRGMDFEEFLTKIKLIPRGKLFRLNQAGDLPGANNEIDAEMLGQLVSAASHTRAWGYTHKPVGKGWEKNTDAIKAANEKITINLSADSLAEADELSELNIAPVVVVLAANSPEKVLTPQGRKVIVCPAQTRENVTCEKCQLCQKKRSVIIGFRAHGIGKNKIKTN